MVSCYKSSTIVPMTVLQSLFTVICAVEVVASRVWYSFRLSLGRVRVIAFQSACLSLGALCCPCGKWRCGLMKNTPADRGQVVARCWEKVVIIQKRLGGFPMLHNRLKADQN